MTKRNRTAYEPHSEQRPNWSLERNPNIVGQIYEIPLDSTEQDMKYYNGRISTDSDSDVVLYQGNLLLCLEHAGDCYYRWALLNRVSANNEYDYYKITNVFGGYSYSRDNEILFFPMTGSAIISALVSMSINQSADILLAKKDQHNG